jgi:3-oxoacyl-[acyl-carrier-protein] synthase II
MTRRVVVTGVGVITPLGVGVDATWRAAIAGKNAIGPIRRFDARSLPVSFAAEAVDPGEQPGDLGDIKLRLALAAAKEALAMSGTVAGKRTGVCMGSEIGRPDLADVAVRIAENAPPTPTDLARMDPATPTRCIATFAGATGPQSTVSTACTSSSQAIGEGLWRIRRGEVDCMIVGGVDVLVDPLMITGFAKLGALSQRNESPETASRPFAVGRDGFVLGEGAGVLILEDEAHALARGATPLAVLAGFGCSCNAYRITDSPPDGRGAFQAMSEALQDAGLRPTDIGYINAHGTSTPMNDPSETLGIHRAFGGPDGSPPVSSTKSMMGHLVAACGAVEAVLCIQAIRTGVLPPTINLSKVDPACALDHVANTARYVNIDAAMTNAFGFGGSNGSLVFVRVGGIDG